MARQHHCSEEFSLYRVAPIKLQDMHDDPHIRTFRVACPQNSYMMYAGAGNPSVSS